MREKILDVAAGLIRQYGLRKFTIDEIASTLKISKKTIYKYFKSKDDIISGYFEETISSDKENVIKALSEKSGVLEKIKAVLHSTHKYPLPVSLLNEIKLFYPQQWEKIESLKNFKINTMKSVLDEGIEKGFFKSDINYAVLLKMLREISDMFVDYDFLIQNKLSTGEAIDKSLEIILYGAVKQSSNIQLC